jgi:hypothetical protein
VSDPILPGGKKLCPSCTTYVGVNDSICGNCGYDFETGEKTGEGSGVAGPPTQPLTVYSESSGPPRITGQGRIVGIAILVVVLAIAGVVAIATNGVFDAAEDVQEQAPGAGGLDFSPGDLGGGTNPATDLNSCVRVINKYLKLVLANDGQPGNLPAILQAAVNEMGFTNPEFQLFTSIYTQNAGSAVTDGTRPALRAAKKDAKVACREEWS